MFQPPQIELGEFELVELEKLLDRARILKSDIRPHQWYEKNMFMPPGSAIPGRVRYDNTPFWEQIVNHTSQEDPYRDISIMAMAQGGKTSMVIHPIIGYTIAESPGNILYLTGATDLQKPGMLKIDNMIDTCGIRHLIKPGTKNMKSRRSGDTMTEKHFRDGILISGSITNHSILRQHDIKISIADDLDGGEMASKDNGGTIGMVTGRTKAFAQTCKRWWISSPTVMGASLIEVQMLKSDQRYWNVPCPRCHKMIVLKFEIEIDKNNRAGIVWKLDNHGLVERSSVGYVCQLCGEFFQETNKYKMNKEGLWVPSATPQEPNHAGYYMSGIYLPASLQNWYDLATRSQTCNPPGKKKNKVEYQTFKNLWLGELYEEEGESPEANLLMKNVRSEYVRGIVPDGLSKRDGNGEIVLMTWTADCNGKLNDARLDWQIVGWSESGARYSIDQGSIGTFIPGEKEEDRHKNPREVWSYELGKQNSVWKVVDEILSKKYQTDEKKFKMIFCGGIDAGYLEDHIFNYINKRKGRFRLFGLMGDKEHEMIKPFTGAPIFKPSRARTNLYMVNVNEVKDDIADSMRLEWRKNHDTCQPYGFMNFPTGYEYNTFYSHYEAESKIRDEKTKKFMWKRKGFKPNHFWDTEVYATAVKEILLHWIFKKGLKQDVWNWQDFVRLRKKK